MTIIVGEVDYPGFVQSSGGRVRYVVYVNKVYFSALTSARESTSTINAAERIIRSICTAEGLEWSNYMFFDIQTSVGYPWHDQGYFKAEKLDVTAIGGGDFAVEGWHQVAGHPRNYRGLLYEVWDEFRDLIGSKEQVA